MLKSSRVRFCRKAARCELPRPAGAHHVHCPNCGEFKITDTALPVVGHALELSERQAYLEQARRNAGPGEVPLIQADT